MVEDIAGKVAAFVREATGVRKRVTSPEPSPRERQVANSIEDLVDIYGVETTYWARVQMPGNHPLRHCISMTMPVELEVDGFEATLRAGDISTNNPSSCPDSFFRLVAEFVSGSPRKVFTLANVDPCGRVTGSNGQRLSPKKLTGVALTMCLMEQRLRVREEADENWKISPHITA